MAGSAQPCSEVRSESNLAFKVEMVDSDLICSRVYVQDASPTMILAVHHNEENPAGKLRTVSLEIHEEDPDNDDLVESLFSALNHLYAMEDGSVRLGGWFNNHGQGLSIVLNDLNDDSDDDD